MQKNPQSFYLPAPDFLRWLRAELAEECLELVSHHGSDSAWTLSSEQLHTSPRALCCLQHCPAWPRLRDSVAECDSSGEAALVTPEPRGQLCSAGAGVQQPQMHSEHRLRQWVLLRRMNSH